MGHAHSTSSSKDLSKQGSDHPPRKFQSYHLPFHKEKGFSKLKRSLFGKKKKANSGSYQHTLSALAGREQGRPLTSTSLQNLPVQTTSSESSLRLLSANSQSMVHSDVPDSSSSNTHFNTWGPKRPFGKPPLPLPSASATESSVIDFDFVEIELSPRSLGKTQSFRDEDLPCYSKVVADAYSTVVKEKSEPKMVEPANRKESSSSSEGKESNSLFEDACDGEPPDNNTSRTETVPVNQELIVVEKSAQESAASDKSPECTSSSMGDALNNNLPLESMNNTVANNEIIQGQIKNPATELRISKHKDSTGSAKEETDSSGEHIGSFCEEGAEFCSSESSEFTSEDSSPWVDVDDGTNHNGALLKTSHLDGKNNAVAATTTSNSTIQKLEEKVMTEMDQNTCKANSTELHLMASEDVHSEVCAAAAPVVVISAVQAEATVLEAHMDEKVVDNTTAALTDNTLKELDMAKVAIHEALVISEPVEDAVTEVPVNCGGQSAMRPSQSSIVGGCAIQPLNATFVKNVDVVSGSATVDENKSGIFDATALVAESSLSLEGKNGPVPPVYFEENDSAAALLKVQRDMALVKPDSSSSEEKVSPSSSNCSASSIGDDIWDDDDNAGHGHDSNSAEAIKTKLVLDLLKNLEVDMGDFQSFLELSDSFEEKYQLLPFPEFLSSNLEVGTSLDALGRCLRVLAKYGLNLVKPETEESKYLKKVILPHESQMGHWLGIQGAINILQVFGYEESGNCLIFPAHEEPDIESTAALVIEMLLAAHEISTHTLGTHPHPNLFNEYLSEAVVGDDLQADPAELPCDILNDMELPATEAAMEEPSKTAPVKTSNFSKESTEEEAPSLTSCSEPDLKTSASTEAKEDPENNEDNMFGRRTVVPWLTEKADSRPQETAKRCHLCGSSTPAVCCERCSNLIFCSSCDDMYHRHPKRRDHMRKVVSIAPPPPPPRPPPKNTDPNKIPVPPPRRRKSQRSMANSPVFGRKQVEQKPELPKKQFPLKFGSLKRFIPGNSSNKPPAAAGPGKEFLQQAPEGRWPSESVPMSPASSSGPFTYPSASQGSLMNDSGRRMDARFIEGRYGCNVEQNENLPGPFRSRTSGYLDSSGYYDGRQLNAAEPSSSDAEEDRGSGACSIDHGSGSFVGSDEWPRTMGTLPPPYGGMTSRSIATLDQIQGYPPQPYQGYSTLSRRNNMMSGTLERSVPYSYHPRPSGIMQHSTSVCDLSNPMMPPSVMGYALPQVQSMASLPQSEMDAGLPLTAPCGCRPNWVGPDAFGQWHPPARCMIHSSANNMYSGGTLLKQQHPPPLCPGYSPEGVFNPRMHPGIYPTMMPLSHTYPRPSPTPPPPPRPSGQTTSSATHDTRPASVEPRSQSPAASARSSESRRKTKAGSGSNRSRALRSHHRRSRPDIGSSSEEDYFSAGESDEEPDQENYRSGRSAGRSRARRTPDGSWECEHCTFINSPGTRICAVCCKTTGKAKQVDPRLDSGTMVPTSSDAISRASPRPARHCQTNGSTSKLSRTHANDDGVYEDLEDGQLNHKNAANEKLLSKQLKTSLQLSSPKEAVASEQVVLTNGTQVEASPPATSSQVVPGQESRSFHKVDAALDPMEESAVNSVQADTQTYATVFKEKILPAISSSSVNAATKTYGSPKSVTSTGTSPPPQSIATQTPVHEAWMPHDHDPPLPKASAGRSLSRLSLGGDTADLGGMFRSAPSALKRASSLHFSGTGTSDNPWATHYMPRSGSRTSLVSDHPLGYPSGPPSRDVSPPRNFTSRRDSSLERGYSALAALMNHQEERGYGPRSTSHNYLSLEELVEKRRQETLRTQGLELVRLLREAEQQNFTADDLQVALNHCGSQSPVQWLQDNWKNMIDTVVTLATNYGHDKKENDIGIISNTEAKDCLRLHKGNIWAAVTECVEQRQKKFIELQHRGNFSRDEVVAALTSNQGSVEAAFNDLNKSALKPFLMRIWGPPAGADNEGGAIWPQQRQPIRKSEESSLVWPLKMEQSSSGPSTVNQGFWSTQSSGQYLTQRDFLVNENQKSKEGSSDLEDYLGLEDVEGLEGSFDEPEVVCDIYPEEKREIVDDVFYDAVPGLPSDVFAELDITVVDIPSPGTQQLLLSCSPLYPIPDIPTSVPMKASPEQFTVTPKIPTDPPVCSPEKVPTLQLAAASSTSHGQQLEVPSKLLQTQLLTLETVILPPEPPVEVEQNTVQRPSGAEGTSSLETVNMPLETPVLVEQHAVQALPRIDGASQSNVLETSITAVCSSEASESPLRVQQSFVKEITPLLTVKPHQLLKEVAHNSKIPCSPQMETEPSKSTLPSAAAVDIVYSERQKDNAQNTSKSVSNVGMSSDPGSVKDSAAPSPQYPLQSSALTGGLPSVASEIESAELTISSAATVGTVQSERQKDNAQHAVKTLNNMNVSSEPRTVKDSVVPSPQYHRENSSLPVSSSALTPESKTSMKKNSTNKSSSKTKSDLDFSRRVRRLLAEGKLPSYERAEVAIRLIDLKFDESEAMHAAMECSDIYMAVSYLQQDCELCTGKFPMGKMISMLNCTHRCCHNCAKDYFTIKIKERNIMEAVCPFCNEPNLSDDDVAVDYFNHLDILLKNLVDVDIHELFQRKLRDRALMSDPNFHWCYKCSSGFIAEPNRRRLVCPDCKVVTCAQCKKPWEKQHDGISCERFAEWKQSNDPEYQLAGLEKYLAENGIDCPKCKFKYALAKGGCMHFICSQCKFEFCSGCGRPFRMSKKCGVSERCEKLGLHAHHPRNCLFYLRDKEPEDLQKLLEDNHVHYNTEIIGEEGDTLVKRCPVIEQKELPDGNEDATCGREVEEGHSGLCRLHYVEYLVSLVNRNALDPVTIMDTGGLQQQLKRKEKPVPEQKDSETDDSYRNTLMQVEKSVVQFGHLYVKD